MTCLPGLQEVNSAFGIPLDEPENQQPRWHNSVEKLLTLIPFFTLLLLAYDYLFRSGSYTLLGCSSYCWCCRVLLTATLLGIPAALLADVVATLATQPLGLYLLIRSGTETTQP